MTSRSEPQTGDDRPLQDALAHEAATWEILEVISRSRADERPVFDVILERAARLCGAPLANLNVIDETAANLELVSEFGTPLQSIRPGHRWALDSELAIVRATREKEVVHSMTSRTTTSIAAVIQCGSEWSTTRACAPSWLYRF